MYYYFTQSVMNCIIHIQNTTFMKCINREYSSVKMVVVMSLTTALFKSSITIYGERGGVLILHINNLI